MRALEHVAWQRGLALCLLMLAAGGAAAAQEAVPGSGAVIEGLLAGQGEAGLSGSVVMMILVVTVLSLAPGLAMMVTCLPFLVIVFSFMRQALGVQQAPPNMMIMALAMFLTFFIMEPVFMAAWQNGIAPYIDGKIGEADAWTAATTPFREFMLRRTDPETILTLADAVNRPLADQGTPSFSLLATAFMLSEVKHAFQIGFVIFLPFLVIDLVVAAVLMAVGMMMVPPTVVSLPFKIGFFVLADGWLKITEALLRGYTA
jgi:flagellar biosynthesis protein FliP